MKIGHIELFEKESLCSFDKRSFRLRLIMDTDDLTRAAYDALIVGSDKISKVLCSYIGVGASQFQDEDSYLAATYKGIRYFSDRPEEFLQRWDVEDEGLDADEFGKELAKLAEEILAVMNTPKEERGPTFEEEDAGN
jgi:hypothetical protein